MPAKKIMLIRHSEKPDPTAGIQGVSAAGEPDHRALSVRGWQRSAALLAIFAKERGLPDCQLLAVPDAIYACKPDIKSSRSLDTVDLLAEVLSTPIQTRYGNDDEAALAERVMDEEGTILICWKHGGLPRLAALILGDPALCPQNWPVGRFDMVWVFDRDAGQASWTFSQVPQLLLPGDLAEPIR
jgi:hypothetical protein